MCHYAGYAEYAHRLSKQRNGSFSEVVYESTGGATISAHSDLHSCSAATRTAAIEGAGMPGRSYESEVIHN